MRKALWMFVTLGLALMMCCSAAQVGAQVGEPNRLSMDVDGPVYVKPGASVTLNMNISNLLQPVCACQAFLSFSSTYFLTGPGSVSVAAGGGVWEELIWAVWNTDGDLDTAVGIDLDAVTGTSDDGTVATIVLNGCPGVEGSTSVVFRPNADPDPFQVASTMLSDMDANPVWPSKVDSPVITFDGTPPLVDIVSVSENGQELIGGGKALQGTVNIQVTASDPVHGGVSSGLVGPPTVVVTLANGAVENATLVSESPTGTYNYVWIVTSSTPNGTTTITASVLDRSGNASSDAVSITVNKNQITGSISMDTLRFGASAGYAFDRLVTFKATNSIGSVLQTWLVVVHFVNNTATGIASGQYTLTDVHPSIAYLSAKTDWSLRRRQAAALSLDGQATVNFTGAAKLLGGDLTTDNVVNVLDYETLLTNWLSLAAVADINGDGMVNVADFNIMKLDWFKIGSPV